MSTVFNTVTILARGWSGYGIGKQGVSIHDTEKIISGP